MHHENTSTQHYYRHDIIFHLSLDLDSQPLRFIYSQPKRLQSSDGRPQQSQRRALTTIAPDEACHHAPPVQQEHPLRRPRPD